LKVAHCNDAVCSTSTKTTVDSIGDVGQYSSIAIGADGLPIISYWGYGVFLRVAHCNDVQCTGGDETVPNVDTNFAGTYTSITIGADGLPIISYRDNANADLKVAHCNDLQCLAATATTVDATGDVGEYTSITIGADGLPIISYYDNTNHDLKVAHCSNALCVPFSRRHGDPGVR
jgi:predicted regulator of Ras-like GTPase activity (Roadblock/LC7/MglB family)